MIVVDVETTGLDAKRNAIISIGALDFSNPENQFYGECGVDKGVEIDPVALKINGFRMEDLLNNRKVLKELAIEFIGWSLSVSDKVLGGYYTHFDQSFLLETVKKYKLGWPFSIHVIDIQGLFYAEMLKNGLLHNHTNQYTLDHILRFVGLPPEPQPHNALTGAKVTAEAISRLVLGKGLLPEFEKYPVRF